MILSFFDLKRRARCRHYMPPHQSRFHALRTVHMQQDHSCEPFTDELPQTDRHTHTHVHTRARTRRHAHARTRTHACTHARARTRTRTRTCAHAHTHTHTPTPTHTRTPAHTHTHTRVRAGEGHTDRYSYICIGLCRQAAHATFLFVRVKIVYMQHKFVRACRT